MGDLSKLMFEIGIKSLKDTIAARERELDAFLQKYKGKTISIDISEVKSQLDSLSSAMSGVGSGKDEAGLKAYQEELSKLNERFDKLISTIEKLNTKSSSRSRRKKNLDDEAEAAKKAESALGGLAAMSKQVGFNLESQSEGFGRASFSVKAYLDNIQKLIREEQVVGNFIKKAQEAIKFGEGHNRDTSQMKAYLQSLYSVQNAIRGLLANREQFKDFLGMYKALERPLPGSNNDLALMGAHLKNLKENVTMADAALRSMAVSLRLSDDGAPNLRRNIEQIEVAITALNKEREKLAKASGRADEFGFSKESIERKRREIEAYIKTLEELKKNETLLKNTRLSALWTPESPGEKAPLGRYFLSLLGAGNEETQRVNELVNNKERIKKAFDDLKNAIQELEKVRAKGLGLGLDISGSSAQVMAARDLLAQLSGAAYNEKMLSNSNGIEALVVQYQTLLDVLLRIRKVQGEANAKAVEKNKSDEKAIQENSKAIEKAIEQYDKLAIKLERAKRLQKEAHEQRVETPKLDRLISEMEQYLTMLDKLRTRTKINDAPGTTVNTLMQEGAYRSLTARLNENTNEVNRNINAKNRLTMEERNMAAALQQSTTSMQHQSQILSDLKSLATQYIGVWGAQGFLQKIIQTGGQLESQRKSLTAILGQATYANDLYSKIQKLAVQSPFGVVQLDQYSKNLSAFGFQYNELFDMTKRLADIAAGTGTDFGRLALAIGHVRSEMALTGYTLRQFAMANVPMLQKLSENLGVTTSEIRKMVREKKVSYEDVVKVLKDLTDESGIFYNMQETMSEAVSAKFKNLRDSMDIMYGQMAESMIGDVLKGIAKGLTEVTKRWQGFGTVIFTTAALLGTYKLYMLAVNRGIQAQTASILANNVSTKNLTAEQVKHLAVTGQITRADLVSAVATGKLTAAQAELAAEYFVLDKAMMNNVASMKRYQLAMSGLGGSGFMAALTNPWTAALIASEALLGSYMAYKQWSDSIYQDVDTYLERTKTASNEIAKYLESANKPTQEKDLSSEIEQMITILKNSELYTEELQKQVNLAPDLSGEYDVLIAKLKECNNLLSNAGVNAATIAEIIKASSADFGGWDFAKLGLLGLDSLWGDNTWDRFIEWATNEDMSANVDDMQKSADALKRVISGMSEYRSAMEAAIQKMIDVYGYTKLSNLPFDEQIQLLAQNKEAWSEFTFIVSQSSLSFATDSKKICEAAQEVSDDWNEIAEDDVPKMMDKMMKEFNMTKDQLQVWAQENETIFSGMLDIMLAKAKERSPQIAQKIRDAILGWINGVAPEKQAETPEERANRHLNDIISRRNAIRKKSGREGVYAKSTLNEYAKGKGLGSDLFDDTFVATYFKSGQGYSAGFEAIQKAYKKTYDAIETAKKVNDQRTINNLQSTFKRLDTAMDAFGLDKKHSGLFPKNKNSDKDEVAKEIRERVRIMKEAADSYQYWRKAVGDRNAFSHVRDEFGELLGEENLNTDNVGNLRENLLKLRAELEKRPKKKPVLEGLKEIDKELAQLDRKDFEKTSEEFASRVKIEIDGLTRAWEIFNNVRQATGDVELAVKLSGVNYSAGGTQNLADSLREKLNNEFGDMGAAIDFNLNLSDEDIENLIKNLVPKESQTKIKGLIEQYSKWRDLQRDVLKNDISTFTNLIDDAESLGRKLEKITDQYNDQVQSLERLRSLGVNNGGISQEMYESGLKSAQNERNLQFLKETVNAVNWGDTFNGIGNVLTVSMRELYTRVMKEIRSDNFKTLNNTQQKSYIDLAKQLRDNGAAGAASPFNLGAWGDLGEIADRYKAAVNKLVTAIEKQIRAEQRKAGLERIINSTETTEEEKAQAKALLEHVMHTIDEAKKEVGDAQTDVNQEGNNMGDASEKAIKGLNNFSTVLGQITSGSVSGFALAIGNLIRTISGKDVAESVGQLFGELGKNIGGIIGAILQIIDALGTEPAAFIDEVLQKVANVVEAVISQIPQIIATVVEDVVDIVGSVFNGIAGLFGVDDLFGLHADYSGYNSAKEAYEQLANVWDDLIDRKRTYLRENWGNESVQAAKEAMSLLKSEIEQTKELANIRLGSGASMGSHSIGYRMWEGSYDYNGINWQDVAGEISRSLGGVRFSGMSDMLNMTSEQLLWIKENYVGLWAHMDGDFKEHLESIIKYNEDIQDILDEVAQKLHGLTMDGLLDSYYNFVTSAENANDVLANDLESKLKEAIVKGMIENLYKQRIEDLIKNSTDMGQNDTYIDKNGNVRTHRRGADGAILDTDVASEYTGEEYALLKQMAEAIGNEEKATYEMLKAIYGWTDEDASSTSVGRTIQSITEQTADLLASYVNAMRADLSVNRAMIGQYFPQYLEAMTQNLKSIRQIEENTAAIMRSNQTIAEKMTSLESMVSGLKNKTWKMPIS